MRPRPIFVLHLRSAPISQRIILPLFLFLRPSPLSFWIHATASPPPPIMPLLSLPTHTPSSSATAFSFIHILLPQQQQTQTSYRAAALSHDNLSLCIYLHSSGFPSSGDFTFISSFFHPELLPLCVGAFLSLPFFPRSCAPHCSPSSQICSPQFSLHLVSFSFHRKVL